MLHMAVAIAELWHYLIDDFGNYLALELIDWSVPHPTFMNFPDECPAGLPK